MLFLTVSLITSGSDGHHSRLIGQFQCSLLKTITRAKRLGITQSGLCYLGPLAADRSGLHQHSPSLLRGCKLHLFQYLGLSACPRGDLSKCVDDFLVRRNLGRVHQCLLDVLFHSSNRFF
jgi:hypothetical protein